MENKLNNLVKALTNFIFYWALFCFILLLFYDFTVYGQLQQLNSRLIYSSSRNDLPAYNNRFEVKSTDDGNLLIMSKNNKKQYKSIRALLPNGPTIDIELNFLDKNITHIFPLTMQYYLLLYGQKINRNMQISGIVLDYDKQIIK
ncbi:7080_t:CDS:1, partial [Gigaspora margarita]